MTLDTMISTTDSTISHREHLGAEILCVPAALEDHIAKLRSALAAKPDQSAAATAAKYLTVAQERWRRFQTGQTAHAAASAAQQAADTSYRIYCSVADASLTQLYRTVEADFSAF